MYLGPIGKVIHRSTIASTGQLDTLKKNKSAYLNSRQEVVNQFLSGKWVCLF